MYGARLAAIEDKLNIVIRLLHRLNRKDIAMANDFEDKLNALAAQVRRNTDQEASAVQALRALAEEIAANKHSPDQIQALTDQLKASADVLGQAIVTTPPASAPATAPDPAQPAAVV